MIDDDLIQQCADPRLEVSVVQQFVAEMNVPDYLVDFVCVSNFARRLKTLRA